MTRDHVVPKSRGGAQTSCGNVLYVCFECNYAKGNRLLNEWLDRPWMSERFLNATPQEIADYRNLQRTSMSPLPSKPIWFDCCCRYCAKYKN